jgi:hypothetical protein
MKLLVKVGLTKTKCFEKNIPGIYCSKNVMLFLQAFRDRLVKQWSNQKSSVKKPIYFTRKSIFTSNRKMYFPWHGY